MSKKVYNKLIRDKIPEIIEADGKKCIVRTLTKDEYLSELDKKLIEEMKEYAESGSVEELADIEEVLQAILNAKGVDEKEFAKIKNTKREKRGGFDNRLFLVEVEESE